MFQLNSRNWFKLLLSPLFLLASIAQAEGPSLNSKCSKLSLINFPSNSNGVIFDEECKNAFVLPVETGGFKIERVFTTTNLGFCPAFLREQKNSSRSFEIIDSMATRIKEMIISYEPLRADNLKQELKVNSLKAELNAAEKLNIEMNSIYIEKMNNFDLIKENLIRLKKDDPEMKHSETQIAKEIYDTALYEMDSSYDKYTNSKIIIKRATRNYEEACERLEKIKKIYSEGVSILTDTQKNIDELFAFNALQYKKYPQMEALTANINFNIDNANIVAKFKEQNRHLNLTWQALPIKEVYFTAKNKTLSGNADNTVSPVIDVAIPGIRAPKLKDIDAAGLAPDLTRQASSIARPLENVGGKITLNLIGGCSIYEDIDKLKVGKSINDIAFELGMNIAYTYELEVKRGYKAKYNLKNIVTKIQKQTKKGGWLSSLSISEIIEDKKSDDWFHISFDDEQSEFKYSEIEKQQISKDVKATLIDSSLKKIAMYNTGNSFDLPQMQSSGIFYASLTQEKCHYFFCQVGSFILGTQGTIYGNSNAALIFQSKNDIWVKDEVHGVQKIQRSGKINFGI